MTSPFEAQIRFSRAKRVGHHIAISGTAPLDDAGVTMGRGDLFAQTKRCLEIVIQAARDKGATVETITRTRIMLIDINLWKYAARAHAEVFAAVDPPPACTFLEARLIDSAWLVEVEADAVVA